MTSQPMPDLIVVIPGILGSVLERDGKEVWGLSGQAMIDNLLSLGRNIQHLALPQGIDNQEPNDGVSVTRLMPDLHMLPGLWTIDGYGKMVNGLKGRFTLTEASATQPGNLLLFPYDWRLFEWQMRTGFASGSGVYLRHRSSSRDAVSASLLAERTFELGGFCGDMQNPPSFN
jgi:hypothetical protein